jgi:hypothetical protein
VGAHRTPTRNKPDPQPGGFSERVRPKISQNGQDLVEIHVKRLNQLYLLRFSTVLDAQWLVLKIAGPEMRTRTLTRSGMGQKPVRVPVPLPITSKATERHPWEFGDARVPLWLRGGCSVAVSVALGWWLNLPFMGGRSMLWACSSHVATYIA